MNVAYVRVSTAEQNEARQKEALSGRGIDRWFEEKISGKNANRPQLKALRDFVREGDTVYVHDFSRLARNTKDLLEIVEEFNQKGVTLVSNHEGLDTSTPTGKLMLTVIGAIAEFERTNLLERQREGIAIAKANGQYDKNGRKPKEINDEFMRLYPAYKSREITKMELAKRLDISRPTLDKLIKQHEKEGEQK